MNPQELKEKFEKYLSESVDFSAYDSNLASAVKYALLGGGKRVRPLLMLLTAQELGQDICLFMDFAVSLEMIHAFSLVHDDLPCMDNDDFRRGLPTVHKKFGEDIALLAGDLLLNLASLKLNEACLELSKKGMFFTQSALGAMHMINSVSLEMINGQSAEIALKKDGTEGLTETELGAKILKIYSGKTSALFASALSVPCIFNSFLSKTYDKDYKEAIIAGRHFGIAFQIADDLSDYDSGQDASEITLVTALGESDSKSLFNDAVCAFTKCMDKLNLSEVKDYCLKILGCSNL